jgi:hypothetical protein
MKRALYLAALGFGHKGEEAVESGRIWGPWISRDMEHTNDRSESHGQAGYQESKARCSSRVVCAG